MVSAKESSSQNIKLQTKKILLLFIIGCIYNNDDKHIVKNRFLLKKKYKKNNIYR